MDKLFYTVFLLLGAGAGYSSAEDYDTSNETNDRYITYQDSENITRVIDLQGKLDKIALLKGSSQGNQYLLYTRLNADCYQELYTNNASSISSSFFSPSRSTIVIVHGWQGNQNSGLNSAIKEAYLAKSDVNIIVLDWSWLSTQNYVTAVAGIPSVGQALGKFLTYLISQTGAKFSDIHLIGFSLGAHAVGNAGRSLATKAARITGLDPAGPLWTLNTFRLQKTDAVYVEAIHTNRHLLGTLLNVGDTDFSPNGGYTQPGCILDSCSHDRSWQYFAATVTYDNMIGDKCRNDLLLGLNVCFGGTLPMGNDDLRKTGSGIYRVKTTSNYPFA